MKNFLLLSTTALLITACTSDWMSDGYVWNDSTPISSPQKTGVWDNKVAEANPQRTQTPQAIISGVSADILGSLETRLSRTTPIYLAPLDEKSHLNALFDHALRTKLTSHGFTLSQAPQDAYALGYKIEKSEQEGALNFIIMDMSEEEPRVIETRTQEVPE